MERKRQMDRGTERWIEGKDSTAFLGDREERRGEGRPSSLSTSCVYRQTEPHTLTAVFILPTVIDLFIFALNHLIFFIYSSKFLCRFYLY